MNVLAMETAFAPAARQGEAAAPQTRPAASPAARLDDAASGLALELHERMEPIEAEWRGLEAEELNSLHQGYDWCAAWAAAHGHPLAILRGVSHGKTQFILPLEITRRRGARVAGFIGGGFNNFNSGLLAPDVRAAAGPFDARALGAQIARLLRGRADLVALRNVPFDWRGSRHPFAALPAAEHHNRSFQLPLLGDMAATLQQLSAKRRRRKYRVQLRKLEELGGYEHRVAATPQERRELLCAFFRQKAARFEALGLPDAFRDAATQDFFFRLAEADRGGRDAPLRLHAVMLKGEHEGHIAAIAGLSLKGGHVICQFGSIDESVAAEASPGEFLFWLMIEQACAEGRALFDFGIGDQPYKRSWCRVETVQHDILLPVSPAGRIAALAERAAGRAKAFVKGNPKLYAALQRLRARRQASASGEDVDGD